MPCHSCWPWTRKSRSKQSAQSSAPKPHVAPESSCGNPESSPEEPPVGSSTPKPHVSAEKNDIERAVSPENAQENPSSDLSSPPVNASFIATQQDHRRNALPKTILTDKERANRAESVKDTSINKGLWANARKKVDPERLCQLEGFIQDGHSDDLQDAAIAKLKAIQESRLKIQIGEGKPQGVRDGVIKVVQTVLGYSSLISAAVAAESHASLAWGSIAALLPILSAALSHTDNALNDLNGISSLLVRFRVIEVVYDLSEHPEERFRASDHDRDLHAQLREQTIDIYARILEYQTDLLHHYSLNQFRRMVKDIAVASQGKASFSEIQSLEADASKTLDTLDSGAIAGLDSQLSSLRQSVDEILDRLKEVQSDVLEFAKREHIEKLPQAVCAAFNEGLNGEIPPSCHKDTRKAILGMVRDWGEGKDDGSRCVFWLNGMAGTGKSTIARTVAGQFHEQGYLGASFFFSRVQEDRAKVEMFFSTLARGLAQRIPGFDACLYQSLPAYDKMQQRSLKDQWECLILKPLRTLESTSLVPVRVVLVIDALDECKGTRAVPDIISLFLEAKVLKRIQLMIFVTSRNEKHILESFEERSDVKRLSLEEGVGATHTEQDISTYVRSELEKIRKGWPEEKQIQELLQWSGKLFIAANTACRFLRGNFPDRRLSEFLSAKMITGKGTDNLDQMYRRLLEIVAVGDDGDVFVELFPRAVGVILASKQPLSLSDMENFLGIDSEEMKFILNSLNSVLIVPQDRNAAVQLFHLSFRDFLLDKRRCQDERFFIDESKAHRRSFEYCLKHIGSQLKKDMCQLQEPGTLFSDIDKDMITQHISPIVRYGCQYWASHLVDAVVSPWGTGETHMALEFLKEHLLHWVETLALIGRIDDAVTGIAILKSLALDLKHQGFADFVDDAHSFILYHRSIIEKAPLQVYYMATVFTPTESLIRRRFSRDYPAWLLRPPTMESQWGREEQVLELDNRPLEFVISPDGSLVAICTTKTITVWFTTTGKLFHTFDTELELAAAPLPGQTSVECLIFSRDGTELAAVLFTRGLHSRHIRAWSLTTGKASTALTEKLSSILSLTELNNWSFQPGHDTRQQKDRGLPTERKEDTQINFKGVSVSADGTIMSLSQGRVLHIGNTDTRQISHTLTFGLKIGEVSLSATRAAIRFSDGNATVWDMVKDHEIDIGVLQRGFIDCLALSHNGAKLAYAIETYLEIWDLDSKQVDHSINHTMDIKHLALFPRGHRLISGSSVPNALLWNLRRLEASVAPLSLSGNRLLLSMDGTRIMVFGEKFTVSLSVLQIWDFMKEGYVFQVRDKGTISVLDSRTLLIPSVSDVGEVDDEGEGHLQAWGVMGDQGDLVTQGRIVPTNARDWVGLAISPSGTKIAIMKPSGSLEFWGYCEASQRWDLQGSGDQGRCDERWYMHHIHIQFSSDETRVLLHSYSLCDCDLAVWSVGNRHCEYRVNNFYTRVCFATLAHNPTMVAIGWEAGKVEIRSSMTGKEIGAIWGHELRQGGQRSFGEPIRIAFSPQDTRVAVGWNEWKVTVHEIATGTTEWVWEGPPSLVNILTFSPNDMWSEKPFYTVDSAGHWILHDSKKIMALPQRFLKYSSRPSPLDYGYIWQDCRGNTIAFYTKSDRFATFMFDGAPSF
ncbi:hypothetical protein BO70DRAFT_426763 [Aspergillus heteromorphus CBS 117.55]|uniref:NACHT domain-containing protein n=1 Tax=Aspergillus heteromorphus CBS 117.55 TaxID=1448321 RepID=A0A317WRL5_9EURO|nr:uncharacterized protein BO70DRAFT_426763 [Aspergillus heteromorphus CBS 117.55]PWY89096.1 hypothetical protein BO70DRAFT_426763 [Aspergillus heteromorphus CBS 117.55]